MHRLIKIGLIVLGMGFLLTSAWAGEERAPGDATAVIETLTGSLIETMKNAESLGYQGRYDKLKPIVMDTHALASIAKYSVGKYWRTLDEEQRNRLVEKFTDYSVATYAGQFVGYGGEYFEIVSERPMKGNKVLVKALLKSPSDEAIRFDYILSQVSDKWLILNIIVEGVSDLALKRAQYTSVIDREGFDALLEKLTKKISMYAEKKNVEEKPEGADELLQRLTDKLSFKLRLLQMLAA